VRFGCNQGAHEVQKDFSAVLLGGSQPSACCHALGRSFGSSDLLFVPKHAFYRGAMGSPTRLGAIHHTHLQGARKPACRLESSVWPGVCKVRPRARRPAWLLA